MKKTFFSLLGFVCTVSMAEVPKTSDRIPGPGAGAGRSAESVPFEVLEGTNDIGKIFYAFDTTLKLRRGVGHSVAVAMLAICPGEANDKIKAFQEMDRALKVSGPEIYRNTLVLQSDGRGRNFYTRREISIVSEPLLSQIAAVLACKQEKRTATEMATMLNSAYEEAIKKEVVHPDTREKLSWGRSLHTLLMVAMLIK